MKLVSDINALAALVAASVLTLCVIAAVVALAEIRLKKLEYHWQIALSVAVMILSAPGVWLLVVLVAQAATGSQWAACPGK